MPILALSSNTANSLFKSDSTLKVDEIVIDAVIVNGGMSKFYMITDRLTSFFGFEPITLLDPDQAVARGAAVYHYLLTNVESDLTDDMKKAEGTAESPVVSKPESQPIAAAFKKTDNHIGIEWGNYTRDDINVKTVIKLVEKLYDAVKSGSLVTEQLTSCVLALGWICDQRSDTRWDIPNELLNKVYDLLDDVMWDIYDYAISEKCERPADVALKMINGDALSDEDEQFLLEKLNF